MTRPCVDVLKVAEALLTAIVAGGQIVRQTLVELRDNIREQLKGL